LLLSHKKILILSSTGGYGHTAAVHALEQVLTDDYTLRVIHPISDVQICGIQARESIYNYLLVRGQIQLINILARYASPILFRVCRKQIEKMIGTAIDEEKPDLVISVIPFLNFPASEAARKRNIPYLIITTDNDLENWSHGLSEIFHPEFKVTVGHDLSTSLHYLIKKGVCSRKIELLGLPIRADFTKQSTVEHTRATYQIPEDKPTVLLMMGGRGTRCTLDYAKEILKHNLPIHLIACAGKNEKLAGQLSALSFNSKTSITVVGFTHKVADLMAVSNLMITKPGPGTINEAIAMKLPVLLDNTSRTLNWERANIDFVLKQGIGDQIRSFGDLPALLHKYLIDPHHTKQVNEAINTLPANPFHSRVKALVDEMCNAVK
jgi:processive 1,2-diacylglycerol beta-glucosyltransferase